MKQILCDRCGQEIKGNINRIFITQEPTCWGMVNVKGACRNIISNTVAPKDYCDNCIEEIERFIKRNDRSD